MLLRRKSEQNGHTTLGISLFLILACGLLLLSVLAMQAYYSTGFDRQAQDSYRKLKAAVFRAVSDREGVDRFMFIGFEGPHTFSAPLATVELNDGIRADVFHNIHRVRNSRPQSVTRLEVYHPKGKRIFRYVEVNGLVTEQVIERGVA